jgi:hypothetical protein
MTLRRGEWIKAFGADSDLRHRTARRRHRPSEFATRLETALGKVV